MNENNIVFNIKDLCEKRGVTFCEVEKAVGIGNGTIARWATRSPQVNNLIKVAKYFDVTVNRLLRG